MQLWTLGFLVFVAAAVGIVNGGFVCDPIDPSCSGHGVCQDNGTCACNGGFIGFDCGLDELTLPAVNLDVPCNKACSNVSQCYVVGTDTFCYCPVDYYGNLCEIPRVKIECGSESMTVDVVPYFGQSPFDGLVYLSRYMNPAANCPVVSNSANGGLLTISYVPEDCGTTITLDSPQPGNTNYSNLIMIQFNKNFVSGFDKYVLVSCILASDGVISSSQTITDKDKQLTFEEHDDRQKMPLFSSLKDKDGMDLTTDTPITIGQNMFLSIGLSDTKVFKKLKLLNCTAQNSDETKTLVLVYDGCKTNRAAAMVRSIVPKNTETTAEIVLFIKAFRFIGSDIMDFTCHVLACKSGDVTCDPPKCNNTGRGKRAAENNNNNMAEDRTVRKSVRIRCGAECDREAVVLEQESADECVSDQDLIAVVVALAVVLGILVILSFTLAICVVRKKTPKPELISEVASGFSYKHM